MIEQDLPVTDDQAPNRRALFKQAVVFPAVLGLCATWMGAAILYFSMGEGAAFLFLVLGSPTLGAAIAWPFTREVPGSRATAMLVVVAFVFSIGSLWGMAVIGIVAM